MDEKKKVIEDVDKDRRYAIDAAVVRTMKSRKVCAQSSTAEHQSPSTGHASGAAMTVLERDCCLLCVPWQSFGYSVKVP